jgi:hypothetical protein
MRKLCWSERHGPGGQPVTVPRQGEYSVDGVNIEVDADGEGVETGQVLLTDGLGQCDRHAAQEAVADGLRPTHPWSERSRRRRTAGSPPGWRKPQQPAAEVGDDVCGIPYSLCCGSPAGDLDA